MARLELDDGFVVTTGFECSAPVIAGGVRIDELIKTDHWRRFAEDFTLTASYGIHYVRLGLPFHVIATSDRVADFDWDWTDTALAAARGAGLEPIVDLFHFNLPPDIHAVADPRLVERFAIYARAAAERYPWLRYYTPVNEPYILALFSASLGLWYERSRDDRSFVAALDRMLTCTVRGMEILREIRPDAIFLQNDSCEAYQAAAPTLEADAAFLNHRRFVAFDLIFGGRPDDDVVLWLSGNGFGEDRLAWFAEHGSAAGCILGHDYYRGSESVVVGRRRLRRAGSRRRGYYSVAGDYLARYPMPFMHAETNIAGRLAPGWLAEAWNDALRLRADGAPIRGFTWYGFVDHVDWDSALTRDRGHVNTCGLVGLDRQPHAVGLLYRQLAEAAASGRLEPLTRRTRRGRAG